MAANSSKRRSSDLISQLPDSILTHILSLIPTKYSVRTKVLSKRWFPLSSLVPTLHFASSRRISDRPFLDFVSHVFRSYNVNQMDIFRFKSTWYLTVPQCERVLGWIQEAVTRRVRELDVMAYAREGHALLPRGVFTCHTLTMLKIAGVFDLQVPDKVCLPQIRTLYLSDVVFTDRGSAQRLFNSCPMLEDLLLNCRFKNDFQVLDISIPSLRTLKIHEYICNRNLVLYVPNVEYFELCGRAEFVSFAVQHLKSLSRVRMNSHTFSDKGYKALEKIFGVICHVRHLSLVSNTLDQAFKSSSWSVPIFHNLAHLEMEVLSIRDSGYVLNLLDKTPHLAVLVIDNRWSSRGNSVIDDYLLPKDVPLCVSLHLKEVKVLGALDFECKLVKYLLKNGKVMDMLKIDFRYFLEDQPKLMNELLSLSSCSRTCQIRISDINNNWYKPSDFSAGY